MLSAQDSHAFANKPENVSEGYQAHRSPVGIDNPDAVDMPSKNRREDVEEIVRWLATKRGLDLTFGGKKEVLERLVHIRHILRTQESQIRG
mmetsp:Transcript_332/g.707  ORF Transcript_332/g.707 Transcript_332/m.707 type:complete len:91 (+) Transcript_332:472-744(+)